MADKKVVSKEVKTEVKAAPKTEVKAEVKAAPKTEVKTEVKAAPKAEVKAAPKAEVKADVKEVKEVKAPKAEAKKAPAKKAVKKEAPKAGNETNLYVQFAGNEASVADVVEKVKAAYIGEGHKGASIKNIDVYIKPEENAAYYVINSKASGKVDLF